jgi:hypothetical protein
VLPFHHRGTWADASTGHAMAPAQTTSDSQRRITPSDERITIDESPRE